MIALPKTLRIDLSALRHNIAQVRALVGDRARIMAMVKSDAYGHGLLPVSRTLETSGTDALAVAYSYEAIELRDGGIQIPIAVLCGVQSPEEMELACARRLTPVIFDLAAAEKLDQVARRRQVGVEVLLKVDTGMGRLGIPWEGLEDAFGRLARCDHLQIGGLMSHLSSADEKDGAFTEAQIGRFQMAVQRGRRMGWPLPYNSLANSAGLMRYNGAHFDMVRPGIMLYGICPSAHLKAQLQLKPVMQFAGRVIQVREFPEHTPISYGRTYYTTREKRRIAVVSAGYGDGLPRRISNRGHILVQGRRAPIVGRICMNLTMCDVTGLEGVQQGDAVVFMGSQGDLAISAEDIARWAHTIAYEIVCSIGHQNQKEFIA